MNRGGWLIGLGLMLVCSGVAADDDHLKARRLQRAGDIVAVETILSQVQQRYHGRVLEVDLEEEGGRYLYEIELVDNEGDVIKLYFDAKTGGPIKDE